VKKLRSYQLQLTAFSSAADMLNALRNKDVSARELLELHLQRIERHNSALHAIATVDVAGARRAAELADKQRARGDDRPLLGLPLTIKDCIYVKGFPATGGLVERRDAVSEEDASPVARIREAGGVIMATTNVPPYASDWQSDNPLFGRSGNPWDLGRTPGGSTGGGAAAVAAGLTPLELGGDFVGSIRIPAAFCGIYGHKPSWSVLPGTGHFPFPLVPNPAAPFAVIGPLARSAGDLELSLKIIAGPEIGEEPAWSIRLPPPRHEALADFRVAVMPPIDWLPVDGDILAALDRVTAMLKQVGATVKVAQPELFGDIRDHHRLYESMAAAMTSGRRSKEMRRAEAAELRSSTDEFQEARADGLELAAQDFVLMHYRRERYRASYREFFRDWDVLLAPANIVNAFPHTDAPMVERTLLVGGAPVPYGRQSVYAGLANLAGQPATAFPAGFTSAGLPIGLQAIGPYLEDLTPIRFSGRLADEFGGFVPPPSYNEDQ
jgi:amidase